MRFAALVAAALLGQAMAGGAARAADASGEGGRPPSPAAPPASDGAPRVAVEADRFEATVGDVVTLTVTAVAARTTPINLPASPEVAPFSLLPDRGHVEHELADGRIKHTFTLKIAAFEPGDLVVPPIEVTYLGPEGDVLTARSAPLPVKVISLLANEPEPALKENAAPVPVMVDDLTLVYAAAGVGIAAVGAALALVVRRRMRARVSDRPAPPQRPPHEIALERLDPLGARGFAPDGDHRPLYFELSEVLRAYLGARFGFDALELTTEELVGELRRHDAPPLVMSELLAWLSASDLVKFAKISPSAMDARGAFETAIRLVEATRPRPEPQVAVGPEGAPGPTGGAHA
jgi:hypothetical protein